MWDVDWWLVGATTWKHISADDNVTTAQTSPTVVTNSSQGWPQHLAQCSWLFNQESLPVTLTLLVIIKWIWLAVFCQFYKFLARFSGRRRSVNVEKVGHIAQENYPSISTFTRMRTLTLATSVILVVSTLLGAAEGCSSRSTPKPRSPSPTARPNVTFHTYACPPAYAAWYCLNGATCFTVKIGVSLLYNCECADGYMGQRCEYKDLEGSYLPSRQKAMLETASIAGGAGVASILVFVVLMYLHMHRQRRRKEMRISVTVMIEMRDRRPFSRHPATIHMDSPVNNEIPHAQIPVVMTSKSFHNSAEP